MMKNKYDACLKQLRISFREHFESTLAINLIKSDAVTNTVTLVSQIVAQLLSKNKSEVMNQISSNPKINHELFGNEYFGHLKMNNGALLSTEQTYELMLHTLISKSSPIIHTMHIHCIFIHRIYDKLSDKILTNRAGIHKEAWAKLISTDTLFKDRGRIQLMTQPQLTSKVGINRNSFFSNKINIEMGTHIAAIDKFTPDLNADFVKKTTQHDLPFVAGISGHTALLLLLGHVSGLHSEHMHHYALAIFSFLSCGGNHTFHEVMIVAQQVGVPFHWDNYDKCLPTSIKTTLWYRNLQDEFSCLGFDTASVEADLNSTAVACPTIRSS